MLKRLALVLIVASCLVDARADSITQINSSASETTNSTISPTQNISGNPAWAAPFAGSNWVSFTNTGDPSSAGFTTIANGTAVIFSDTFNLVGPVSAATLMVMADDTAAVIVNGTTIFAADLLGPYPTCSASGIGCLSSTAGVFGLTDLQPYLNIGANTISFEVYQEGGSSYGVDYSGSFTVTSVPEPGTLVLLACGLIGLMLVGWRSVVR